MLRLILPDSHYLASYLEALREGFYSGNASPKTEDEIAAIEVDPFPHLKTLNKQGGFYVQPNGTRVKKVPDNTYWLVDGSHFYGSCNIRHELNDFLKMEGGHCGYGIRPSQRGKGYGKVLLSRALDVMQANGLDAATVTADDVNVASWRIIEANGGVQVGAYVSAFDSSKTGRRYRIDLTNRKGAS